MQNLIEDIDKDLAIENIVAEVIVAIFFLKKSNRRYLTYKEVTNLSCSYHSCNYSLRFNLIEILIEREILIEISDKDLSRPF